MSNLKKEIIDGIIEVESGYSNDIDDSGGETNHGITIKVARDFGYKSAMIDLPRETAFRIYDELYWTKPRLDEIVIISERVAEEVADTGVNLGVRKASEFLQQSLTALNYMGSLGNDLIVDGNTGDKTLNLLALYINKRGRDGEDVLYKMLNSLQGAFYISLKSKRKYMFGWFKNRVS